MRNDTPSLIQVPLAGLLGWLVPGLGHIYLGHRARGTVFLVTVTATFWTGVAIGGVPHTVNPQERKLWFLAQACTAGNALTAYAISPASGRSTPPARANRSDAAASFPAHWMSADIGVHYTGVAGLLNLLVIFDALARSERPRRRRESGAGPPGQP